MKKNVILFGTGSGLKDILSILPERVNVVALCDNDEKKHGTLIYNYKVIAPKNIADYTFDYIVITTQATDVIKAQLKTLGVSDNKVLLINQGNNSTIQQSVNSNIQILNTELGFKIPEIGLSTMYLWPNTLSNATSSGDYVRYMALQLVSEQINSRKLKGSVAELGVYRGDFSLVLNTLFSDKKLYLFDTFEGFSEKDIKVEDARNFSVSSKTDFSNTNDKQVYERMPHKEKVQICKGYFPETTKGIEDEFCFVSIDVDLYAPTLAGLEYFYPRLVKGGYIFIHDYNSKRYQGVKNIVDEFIAKENACAMPLPDFAGSIIIIK
jgi:O-methyltransferase